MRRKKVTGSWYQDNNFELHFAPNIHNEAEFLKSEYAQKGTWWATEGGVGGGGNYTTDPYSSNYAPDGSITRSYVSGKRERYDYDGAVYLLNKGDENYKLIKAAPKPKNETKAGKIKSSIEQKDNQNVTSAKSESTNVKHPAIRTLNDIYGKGTFIPGTAVAVVTTRFGFLQSIGGSEHYKALPFRSQLAAYREFQFASNIAKGGGTILGAAGVLLSATDIVVNGRTTSNMLDFGMGLVSFIPGGGWIIGGTYFILNEALKFSTHKDIGEHLNQLMK